MKPSSQTRLQRVAGRHNPLLKALRQAFARGELTEDGNCAIEGVRVIEEAIRSGLRFRAVFFSESAETRANRLLPQIGAHVETLVVPDKVFAQVTDTEHPQGVAALVQVKQYRLPDLLGSGPRSLKRVDPSALVVVIAGLQDPGNLGTIVRSAEAFGAQAVITLENTVSIFNSKVMRASAGSVFRVAVVAEKLDTALPALRQHGLALVATSSHKGTPLPEANLANPVAILIGGEGAGLPRQALALVDEVVVIPHFERVESLNAGVAASIFLYEAARQRSAAAGD
jgi:RNA methyltransferase, TrmH family